ncbi:MAG: ribbon-helix-helix domain-containing protein [Bdellovibrionales bacterium]
MFERLPEKDREFIKSQVHEGYYASEIEVVRDAVRRLREKTREEAVSNLRQLIMKGHEQLERGEGQVLDRALMEQIAQDAKEHARQGLPIKDEVKY